MVDPDAWTLNYNGIDAVMTNGSAQIGRNVYTLVSEPGRIALSLSQMEVYDLVWNGSDGNMTWQAGTGTNMTHGGVSETYELGDNVTFGETGAGDVTISGRVGASGTLQFTGGVYTFANDPATDGSGLFGAVDLRLSGNASVTFSETQQVTGAVTLADTAQLTISKDTFVNLASADLGSDTKLNVTGAFNDSASADSLGKVTGTGTLSVILRSGGTNYSKVTLSDDFNGTFEFSGNWALAGSSEGMRGKAIGKTMPTARRSKSRVGACSRREVPPKSKTPLSLWEAVPCSRTLRPMC